MNIKTFNKTVWLLTLLTQVHQTLSLPLFLPKPQINQPKESFNIQNFNPDDPQQYEQILKLMVQEKEFLLNPNENPEEALQKYIAGMKAKKINRNDPYSGLLVRVMMAKNKLNLTSKVVGFVAFNTDQYKTSLRTLAIDPKYRNKGFATKLLKDVEAETKKRNLDVILLVVYSHNTAMLKLIKKLNYKFYLQHEKIAFSLFNSETRKCVDVYSQAYTKSLKK